jgi:cellulose biosynthesis protein BcsQ
MVKRIALFNHKGGVSKTTTTFNIGWMLAAKGHRVVLVDADPQCNLSGLILGYKGPQEFENFYQTAEGKNIRAGLAPAFESRPQMITPVECIPVGGIDGLYLLPGHIRLSEYETTLGIAQELSGSIQALQNLPGSFTYLFETTAKELNADYILIDMNPSLGSINQNLLMTSDCFLVPTTPDYFSLMAVHSLSNILPRWHKWSKVAQSKEVLQEAVYPYPGKDPKFLGVVIQNYRPRGGAPAAGFQKWIDQIGSFVSSELLPVLYENNMAFERQVYERIPNFTENLYLAQIPDFNTLITRSQESRTPVFALKDDNLQSVGAVLDERRKKREEFHQLFSILADRILLFTEDMG